MRKRLTAALAATAATCLAAGAVAPAFADTTPPKQGNSRIAGSNRYATAVAVSKATFQPGTDPIPVVVVATGDNWPDGLAGSGVAGNIGGPLLLTPKAYLPADVKAELQRLKPAAVMIAGSTGAVSTATENAIKAALPGADVWRDYGSNRYGTAAAMSRDLYAGGAQTIYIASGKTFADAIGTSSPAALSSGPLLLADSTLPVETKNELLRLKAAGIVENVIVMGGTSAVSKAVFDQVNTIFGKVPNTTYDKTVRVAGADRYSTTQRLVDVLWDPTTSTPAKAAYYVHGNSWPDALAAGAVAAVNDAPVLLTGATCMPWATKDWDTRNSGTLTSRTWVGGAAAVTTAGC